MKEKFEKEDRCLDQKLKTMVEKFGISDKHGHKLYGSVAVTYIMYAPVSALYQSDIAHGEAIVEKILSA